jgi:hypothetical protein
MLENLINVVEQCAQGAVAQNNDIPADQKDVAAKTIASSVVDGLKNHVQQEGGVMGLLSLFSKTPSAGGSPAMSGIQSVVVNEISKKIGVSPVIASGIVAAALPMVLKTLGNKAGDPQDKSIDFNSLIQAIGGGQHVGNVDVNSVMQRVNDDKDSFGLNDVAKMLGGAPGLMGMLGGLFKGK